MEWDEPVSGRQPKAKDLSVLGVADLKSYIDELRTEIVRAEAEIARRETHQNAAAALFRSSSS